MKKWAIALALMASMALLVGANRPPVGVGNGIGVTAQVGRSASGIGVGADSGWDTVTVVLAMSASMTYPASATHNDSLYTQRFLADVAAADTVIELGTGKDVPSFAWSTIKEDDTTGYYSGQFTYFTSDVRQTITGPATYVLQQTVGNDAGTRQIPMFYVPFEDVLPRKSTMVSARAYFSNFSAMYFGYSDTLISVLLTAAADSAWYENKGGVAMTSSPNYAKASWLYQHDTDGGTWSDVTRGFPWSTPLSTAYYWDLGRYSDWSGSLIGPSDYIPAYSSVVVRSSPLSVDITDCVQASVNGVTNNGIMVLFQENAASGTTPLIFGWDAASTAIGRQPWIKIKYLTKKYISPYPGGADAVASFSTDDFIAADNDSYITVFNRHNMKYTIFGARVHVDAANEYQADMAKILSWRDDYDMEIGSHSWWHKDPEGLPYWQQVEGEITQAVVDSIYRDSRPSWMYTLADSADGNSRLTDQYFGKSLSLPNSAYSGEVMNALVEHGYAAARAGAMDSYDRDKYYAAPTFGPARGDSIASGAPTAGSRNPRNMLGMPMTVQVNRVVGAKGNVTDPDSVAHNMRRLVNQIRGQDRGELVFAWHETKSYGPGWYAEGVDPSELEAMLDVLDEYGIPTMRASELGRWRRNNGEAISTPTGYAANDSLSYGSLDRVWFIPDGVDNRFIRGVRTDEKDYNFDTTAPLPPSNLVATGFDEYVYLDWDASPSAETVRYTVYRYFDGSPDTVTVASGIADTYYLATAINGTEHFYFVSASDNTDNESYDSNHASATPGGTLGLQYPAYFAMYYHDPAASAASSAQLDSLGEFDAVVFGPHAFEGDANEPFYEGMSAALKSRNTNIVLLNYTMAMTPRDDWGTDYPAGSPQKRSWDYIASIADSAGFGKNVAGYVTTSDAYPTKFVNVMLPATADTMARYFVDGLEDAGTDGTYSGFFIDLADSALYGWICYDGGCDDAMDYDQDDSTFSVDSSEQAAYKAFQLEFVKGLRRELAEHGMGDRLIVGNGDFPRTNAQYAKYFDGFMWEGWNQYTPGPQGSESAWEAAADAVNLLVNAQTSPPLVLWQAKVDSSSAFITEPIAVGTNGFVHVANAGDTNGEDAIPAMVRRLPNPGAMTTANDFSADTLRVSMASYDMFLNLNHAAADTYGVWPYLVIDGADTLSVGGGWLRYIAPPGNLDGYTVEADDNVLYWDASDRAVTYNIYRGASGSTTLYDDGIATTTYSDASTPHDSSAIYYAVAAVDSAGNVSPKTYELGLNSTVYVTPQILTFDMLGWDSRQDDTIEFYVSWSANKDVGWKLRTWSNNEDEPDTSSGEWGIGPWVDGGEYQFGSTAMWPTSDADSTFTVSWNRATPIPTSGYRIDGQRNNGSWITLADALVLGPTDSTLVVDADSGPGSLELRGKWLVRAYGVSGDTLSQVAVADSALYNDATEVHGKLKIWDGTTYVISAEENGIIINYTGMGADVTAPDTTGVFTSVAYDTTTASNVRIDLTGTASENVQVAHQWKNGAGGTWTPVSDNWRPGSASTAISDTIYTLDSTATLDGDTTYTRFKLRDGSLNESGWAGPIKKVFARAAEAAGDTILYVFSNTSTGYTLAAGGDNPERFVFTGPRGETYNVPNAYAVNSSGHHGWLAPQYADSVLASTISAQIIGSSSEMPLAPNDRAALIAFDVADSLSGMTVIASRVAVTIGAIGVSSGNTVRIAGVDVANLTQWATENDVSFDYYNTSASSAWSPTLDNYTTWASISAGYGDTVLASGSVVDGFVSVTSATSAQAWADGSPAGVFWVDLISAGSADTWSVNIHSNSANRRPVFWVLGVK